MSEKKAKSVKVCDLEIPDEWKMALAVTIKGATTAQLAATTDRGYQSVATRMKIFEAKGWVKRRRNMYGSNVWFLNKDNVEP